jgi:carbon storage regulator CsrA
MLILSRKPNQKIVLPNLGVSIEIVRIAGRTVSVGIEAPDSVKVLRGELAANLPPQVETSSAPERHRLRNELNRVSIALELVRKQLELGRSTEAEQTLERALEWLEQLDTGAQANVANTPAALPRRAAKQALLVEDDANERELLAGYLRLSGYEVCQASNGADALNLLQQHPVDLVVMDMQMPRMNGLETLQEIRKAPHLQNLEVVVVSGAEQRELQAVSQECGVKQVYQKPLNPADLVRYLNDSLKSTAV